LARRPELWLSRSWTTRPPRPTEGEEAYQFVDRATFEAAIAAGRFLEWAEILGEYYGTPLPDDAGERDVVLEIDVQGARQVLERCNEVLCVLVVAPGPEAQAARLRGRGDAEEHVARRLALGEREVEQGRAFADAVVVNDDLDQATDELEAIIASARKRFAISRRGHTPGRDKESDG
jgi:guanylate kinase